MRFQKQRVGFTLSEVLIALALLGIIAAFAIPKLLQSTAEGKKKARFQETLAAISEVQYAGMLTRELRWDNAWTYFSSHLNALRICEPGTAESGGCWVINPQEPVNNWEKIAGVIVLPNGVAINGLQNNVNCSECDTTGGEWGLGTIIDYNGTQPPNVVGADRLMVHTSYGTVPRAGYENSNFELIPPGSTLPYSGAAMQANQDLYQLIRP